MQNKPISARWIPMLSMHRQLSYKDCFQGCNVRRVENIKILYSLLCLRTVHKKCLIIFVYCPKEFISSNKCNKSNHELFIISFLLQAYSIRTFSCGWVQLQKITMIQLLDLILNKVYQGPTATLNANEIVQNVQLFSISASFQSPNFVLREKPVTLSYLDNIIPSLIHFPNSMLSTNSIRMDVCVISISPYVDHIPYDFYTKQSLETWH